MMTFFALIMRDFTGIFAGMYSNTHTFDLPAQRFAALTIQLFGH